MRNIDPFNWFFQFPGGMAVFCGMVDPFDEDFVENILRGQFHKNFRADLKEEKDEYVIEAELPGFDKDNIEVFIDDNVLKIRAVRNEVTEEETEKYINRERVSGEFVRSFYIPDIDPDKVTAKYENGILKISIPKQSPPQNRKKIKID